MFNQGPSSLHFSCLTHPSQKVNNFCNSPECLLPLCSSCIVDHIITHYKQGSLPELLDFYSVHDKCINRISKLRSSLSESIKEIQKTQGELPIPIQKEMEKIRKSREEVNSFVETFYSDLFQKANLPSDATRNKLQKLLEEIQVLEGKIKGEEYQEAIKSFYKRDFEQEIDEMHKNTLINPLENNNPAQENTIHNDIKVEVNYAAFEKVKKELASFVSISQHSNDPIAQKVETSDPKESEGPSRSATASKYSPSSNLDSHKGKDSTSANEQTRSTLKRASSEKLNSQYLTPPQEPLCDQLSTGVPEDKLRFHMIKNECGSAEVEPFQNSPSNSLGAGRTNIVNHVIPKSLNFADSGSVLSNIGENNKKIERAFSLGCKMEVESISEVKSEMIKPKETPKQEDKLAHFRNRFTMLQSKPANAKPLGDFTDEAITAKRSVFAMDREEPDIKKMIKPDFSREADYVPPMGSRFLSESRSLDFLDALRLGKASLAHSTFGTGDNGLRSNISCFPSVSKDDGFLIDDKIIDDSLAVSSPCQLSQHDMDAGILPSYYLVDNFGENDSVHHYQNKDRLSTKDKSPENENDLLSFDHEIFGGGEIFPSETTKKETPVSSFHIDLKDYFNPDSRAKLLHFFEWRSKNLHLVHLDQLSDAPKGVKFKTIVLSMNFFIYDYHTSLITPEGEICMLGGRTTIGNTHKQSGNIYTVNLAERKVVKKTSMIAKRDSHAICYSSGFIYIIGGITFDGSKPAVSRMCERYNLETNECSEIAQAPLPVSNHCACVFQGSYIFCFGGRHRPNKLSNNILRYNIEKDAWLCLNLKANSQTKLNFGLTSQGACCQINENHIFIFGGYHENRAVSDQSFLFSYIPETEESLLTKLKSQSFDLQKDEVKNKGVWIIKGLNNKKVSFAAPFWDKQIIVNNGKIYCLQNAVSVNDPKVAYSNQRRLLMFDGEKWNNLI